MPKIKWNYENFVEHCSKIHNNKYDYSKAIFRTSRDKVMIICPIHGGFSQLVLNHIKGQMCPECSKITRGLTKRKNAGNSFIEKAKLKHGDKYDYSLVVYNRGHSQIKIICKIHGIFEQSASSHLHGRGCPTCYESMRGNSQKFTKELFIEKAKLKHGDKYDYSKVEYVNSQTKVIIICKTHGEFLQVPNSHLVGYGCQLCAAKINADKTRKTTEQFIKESKNIHGDMFDYSKVEYKTNHDDVIIICKKHGEFKQTPWSHISGRGCPTCCMSVGERIIRKYLTDIGLEFETQKKFKTCVYKRQLMFDFYIPKYNLIIEFDGIQHYPEELENFKYNYRNKFHTNSEIIKKRDKYKDRWCEEFMVNLLRIKYDENPIEKIEEYISFLNS